MEQELNLITGKLEIIQTKQQNHTIIDGKKNEIKITQTCSNIKLEFEKTKTDANQN